MVCRLLGVPFLLSFLGVGSPVGGTSQYFKQWSFTVIWGWFISILISYPFWCLLLLLGRTKHSTNPSTTYRPASRQDCWILVVHGRVFTMVNPSVFGDRKNRLDDGSFCLSWWCWTINSSSWPLWFTMMAIRPWFIMINHGWWIGLWLSAITISSL